MCVCVLPRQFRKRPRCECVYARMCVSMPHKKCHDKKGNHSVTSRNIVCMYVCTCARVHSCFQLEPRLPVPPPPPTTSRDGSSRVLLQQSRLKVSQDTYGVASSSRLLKIIGLFCKRALLKRRYSAKETWNFKEPTNRSHLIHMKRRIHSIYMKRRIHETKCFTLHLHAYIWRDQYNRTNGSQDTNIIYMKRPIHETKSLTSNSRAHARSHTDIQLHT